MKVDLSQCNPGDLLLTSKGSILKYLRPTNENEYLDHKVQYIWTPELGFCELDNVGTRTNDGFVFKNNRIPETDHDVVAILPGHSVVNNEHLKTLVLEDQPGEWSDTSYPILESIGIDPTQGV